MANQIQIIRSGTTGAQPNASELELGELALNYADGKLFYKDDSNNIQVLNDTSSNSGNKLVVHPTETKIGIGTSSPEYALDIGGSTGNTSNTLRIHQQSGGTAIRIGTGSATSDTTILRVDGGELDSPTLYGGESDKSNDGFSIKYDGTGSDEANYLQIFADNQDNASQNLALSISQSGKVGIGLIAANVTLDVEDDLQVTGLTPSLRLHKTPGDDTHDQTWLALGTSTTDNAFEIQTRSSSGVFLSNDYRIIKNSSGALNHQWSIANSEKIRLDSTGLGIGTTASEALDVNGNIEVSGHVHTSEVIAPEVADALTLRSDPESPNLDTNGGAQISLHSQDSSVSNQIYIKSSFTYFQNTSDAIVASISATSTPSATTDLTPKDYVDQSGIPNIVQAISNKRMRSSEDLPDAEAATLTSALWPSHALKDNTSDRTWSNINKYPLYASITPRRSNSMFRITINAFGGVQGDDGCGVIVTYNTGSYSHGSVPTGLAETVIGNDEGVDDYRNATFMLGNADDGNDSYTDSGHWNGLWTPSSGITAGTTVNFFLSLIGLNDDDDGIMFNSAYTSPSSTHSQGVYPTNIMIEEIFTQ